MFQALSPGSICLTVSHLSGPDWVSKIRGQNHPLSLTVSSECRSYTRVGLFISDISEFSGVQGRCDPAPAHTSTYSSLLPNPLHLHSVTFAPNCLQFQACQKGLYPNAFYNYCDDNYNAESVLLSLPNGLGSTRVVSFTTTAPST